MQLSAEGLELRIAFAPPDVEEWMGCRATIRVPGFAGHLEFQMLQSDLESFRAQLAASLIQANWPCEIRLVSSDPGVDLSFGVKRTGQVFGEYQLGGCGCFRPRLSGTFRMDQTYLGPLLAQVDEVLNHLK